MKKRSIAKYILLNIITLGIYGIFFWYKWTKDVNAICEGDEKDSANYLLVLILDVFSFGINILVWNYQMAERLYQKAADYGVEIKHGGLFVMLCKFLPLVSSILKISYINKFVDAYNAKVAEEDTAESADSGDDFGFDFDFESDDEAEVPAE